MEKRILLIGLSTVAWLALSNYVAQHHFMYAVLISFSGAALSWIALRGSLINFIFRLNRSLDSQATSNVTVAKAVRSLRASIDGLNKKIKLSVEGINTLGKQEELKELDSVLQNDVLGDALKNASQLIARIKTEEAQRKWITEGLASFAKFSHKTDLKEYCTTIISALARYLNANQGGLFLAKDDDAKQYLELTGCYAYERSKHLDARIEAGDGVLGQCLLEREFVFITNVPKGYVRIASGLGEATPRSIAIAPLIERDVFYGAIELGLFHVMSEHEIEFLKKVCENIASEIASIRYLEETKQHLDESNVLTVQLQTREVEMKQNLAELAAAQTEMARKQAEIDSYLAAINVTIASAEFSLEGVFMKGNDIFLKVLGYQTDQLKSTTYLDLMPETETARMMWTNLNVGKFFSGEFKMKDHRGNETWLTGTFNPVVGVRGEIEKIMMLAQFVTQDKERLNDLTEMANLLKTTLPLAEFNEQFVCKTANDRFMKMFGISRLQLKGKSMFDFIDDGGLRSVAMKDALSKGCVTTTLPIKVNNQNVNFEISISKSTSLDGRISKFTLVLIKESDQKISMMEAV